jgi:hypothetical protein
MAVLRFRKSAEEIGTPTIWRDINSDRMSAELTEGPWKAAHVR